jgi:hypothetical protein
MAFKDKQNGLVTKHLSILNHLGVNVTVVAQQNVTKIIPTTFVNLVTSKAGAKHELLFNKLATSA